jgi:hypothetical protein
VSQEFEAGDRIPAAPPEVSIHRTIGRRTNPKRFGFGFLMISSKLRFAKQGAIPHGSDFAEGQTWRVNSLNSAASSGCGYFRCGSFVDFVPQDYL